MRFEIDAAVAGRTLTGIQLRLHTDGGASSNGPSAGELWQVTPFTRASLFSATPAKVGTAPLATGGSIGASEEIRFSVPRRLVTACAPVFLGIFPTTSDGIGYYDERGAIPPALLVSY